MFGKVLAFLQAALGALPKVIDAAQHVERFFNTASSEEKKAEAMKILAKVPTPKGWCEDDWRMFLSGMTDAVVAVLNWRGIFKHAPDHPCAK